MHVLPGMGMITPSDTDGIKTINMTSTEPLRLVAIHSDIILPDEAGVVPNPIAETVQRVYPLLMHECWIGRNRTECQIVVRANRVDISRRHARITQWGPDMVLEDTGSRHGTFVNGQRIDTPWKLQSGDVIGLAGSMEMLIFEDPAASPATPVEPLTEREVDVLRLVATGASNQDVAAQLNLSVHTVKDHLKNIFQKLNSDNRAAAVHEARRRRLL